MSVDLEALRDDPAVFAEVLVGEPLWPHQVEFVRSPARTRAVCAGRQCGKSRAVSVLALHTAFAGAGRLVLLVSATELSARRLLSETAALVASPLLAGSVVDETKSEITLSNGSRIVSVPASMRQVRGWSAHLLVLDEAAFIPDEVIRAARFVTLATGGRTVWTSTPWGRRDRPFAVVYEAGRSGASGHESWHWPSTVSPLVSEAVLEEWRASMTDREFATEVLGEWADDAGAYFTAGELDGAVADLGLEVGPAGVPLWAGGLDVNAGVDWGLARDANALVCSGPVPAGHELAGAGRWWVSWIREEFGRPYAEFIDLVVGDATADRADGLRFGQVMSETNGVGAMPSEVLRQRFEVARAGSVVGVATSASSKASMFGAAKFLIQRGGLILPRHPGLLRQLAALEFEALESGTVRIAVPDRKGHDDLAMAFSLSLAPIVDSVRAWSSRMPLVEVSYSFSTRDRRVSTSRVYPMRAELERRAWADPELRPSMRARERTRRASRGLRGRR